MRKELRDFFKAERQRLGLNQTVVAARAGLTQGMVSRIEIEPDYEPTFDVFEKAVKGLGLTLSSFFTQIEGLPALPPKADNSQHPEPSDKGVSDEGSVLAQLPANAGASRAALAVIDYLTGALIRARRDAEMHRPPSGDRVDPPGKPQRRADRARPHDRRTRRGRRKRGKE